MCCSLHSCQRCRAASHIFNTPAAVLSCCSVAKGDLLNKELAAMRSDEELLTSFINNDCAQIQGRTGMRRMQAM